MQVNVEQTDPCTLVLDVSIDEQQVARAFDSSYREFGKYANVPGFRPGKAPRNVVERFVDAERVRQHTLEKLVRETYIKAVQEQSIEPYRDPQIDPTDLEDKKPFTYRATIPLEPSVVLGEYNGFTVEQPVFPIKDAMVDRQIEQLREERARLERVQDRGVEATDVLIAEVQIVLEGDEEPEPAKRQLVQLGKNIPGYDEALLGLQIGEERSFELAYPEDFDQEDRRGKKATYNVKLSSISSKRLPDLDDDFAKSVAGVQTVDELRVAVRERLDANALRVSNEIGEQRIIEQILERAQVHYPDILVREEVEEKYRQLSIDLRQRTTSYAQYLQQIGLSQEEHQSNLFVEAEGQIRSLLALREVAKAEGMQASEESIDGEFVKLLQAGRITDEQFEEYLPDPRRRMQVANALIQQALHDYLFANNTIVQVVQTDTPTEIQEEIEQETEEEAETEEE